MQSDKERTKINSAIETAIKNLGAIIDVNTVIGTPLKNDDGSVIVPVSKVTFGILTGGGEYGKINIFNKGADLPYSAGNGAVVSLKPCGFLVKNAGSSDYKIISMPGNYENLIDKAAEFLSDAGKSLSGNSGGDENKI